MGPQLYLNLACLNQHYISVTRYLCTIVCVHINGCVSACINLIIANTELMVGTKKLFIKILLKGGRSCNCYSHFKIYIIHSTQFLKPTGGELCCNDFRYFDKIVVPVTTKDDTMVIPCWADLN